MFLVQSLEGYHKVKTLCVCKELAEAEELILALAQELDYDSFLYATHWRGETVETALKERKEREWSYSYLYIITETSLYSELI